MPFEGDPRPSHIHSSHDDSVLLFNPFADHFTSAIEPKRPRYRRRGSGSKSTSSSDSDNLTAWSVHGHGHSRSRTEGHTRVSEQHPLRSPVFALESADRGGDAGVTRPHLNRLLSALDRSSSPAKEAELPLVEVDGVDDKVVLVHQVSSNDSLAGVALRYGITVADLRRTNHMWASDSIHLRSVLYIPLDKTHPARTPAPLIDFSSSNSSTDDLADPLRTIDRYANTGTIRRIPASQLSYFPPPSHPSPKPSGTSTSKSYTIPRRKRPPASTIGPSASSSPGTLESILTALPIAASTRDTLIARLSFDSAPSSAAASDEQEHELAYVRPARPVPPPLSTPTPSTAPTPKRKLTRRASSVDRAGAPHVQSHPLARANSTGAGVLYAAPPSRPATIRTVQLGPSPVMRLPLRPKGKETEQDEGIRGRVGGTVKLQGR